MEDVKTAIVRLLMSYPEGLNFNKIFEKLKDRKVLGSFSVLSRAMKELGKSKIVSCREVKKPRYKIPMRIYTLAQQARTIFEKYDAKDLKHYLDETISQLKEVEEEPELEEFFINLLEELNINRASDAAFLTLLLRSASRLAFVYDQIIEEKGDPKGSWRLILNDLLRSERRYMEGVAQRMISGNIRSYEEQRGRRVIETLSRLHEMLMALGIWLASKGRA